MYNHVAKFVFRYVSDWLTSCLSGRHDGQWEERCWYSRQPGACEAQFGYHETLENIRKYLESESGRCKSSTWLDQIAKGRGRPVRGCIRLKTDEVGPADQLSLMLNGIASAQFGAIIDFCSVSLRVCAVSCSPWPRKSPWLWTCLIENVMCVLHVVEYSHLLFSTSEDGWSELMLEEALKHIKLILLNPRWPFPKTQKVPSSTTFVSIRLKLHCSSGRIDHFSMWCI